MSNEPLNVERSNAFTDLLYNPMAWMTGGLLAAATAGFGVFYGLSQMKDEVSALRKDNTEMRMTREARVEELTQQNAEMRSTLDILATIHGKDIEEHKQYLIDKDDKNKWPPAMPPPTHAELTKSIYKNRHKQFEDDLKQDSTLSRLRNAVDGLGSLTNDRILRRYESLPNYKGLFIEDKDKTWLSADASYARLSKAGFERHMLPQEAFGLIIDNLEGKLDGKLKDVAASIGKEWLSLAMGRHQDTLTCYVGLRHVGSTFRMSEKKTFDVKGLVSGGKIPLQALPKEFVRWMYGRDFKDLPRKIRNTLIEMPSKSDKPNIAHFYGISSTYDVRSNSTDYSRGVARPTLYKSND